MCPRRLLPFRHRLLPRQCPPGAVRGALGLILLLAACSTAETPTASAESGRILDPVTPEFGTPTEITNPLFPAGTVDQVILLGEGANRSVRVEVTLLSRSRTVEWDGRHVETRASQRVTYRDGELLEVAVGLYAQDDDGSVWQFGAEVDKYAAGVVISNEGSWLAGRDGPPGVVMPAQPAVGDVFHAADIPGVAYDEVKVVSTTERVETTLGPAEDAVLVEVQHMDGTEERKLYVPGYGAFRTEAGGEALVVALALPVDARTGPVPGPVTELSSGALALYDWTADGKAPAIDVSIAELATSLAALEADSPPRLFDEAEGALDAIRTAATVGGASPDMRRASCVAALAAADLAAPYRERQSIDVERMRLWARIAGLDAQAGLDEQADTRDRLRSDVAILETIWARVGRLEDRTAHLHASDALVAIRGAVDRDDAAAATASAMILVRALEEAARSLEP